MKANPFKSKNYLLVFLAFYAASAAVTYATLWVAERFLVLEEAKKLFTPEVLAKTSLTISVLFAAIGTMTTAPLGETMEKLRNDIDRVRGKLGDIRKAYGWDGRITHLEGGLTCMLVAMHKVGQDWDKFEKRHNV